MIEAVNVGQYLGSGQVPLLAPAPLAPPQTGASGALEAAPLAAVVRSELLLVVEAEELVSLACRLDPAHASRTSSPERSDRVAPVS